MPTPGLGPTFGLGLPTPAQQPPVWMLSGNTKDSTGAALGGCTVDVFDANTREFVAQTVSGSDGSWTIAVPFMPGDTRTFYARAYLSGAPDVAGTTLNTLTPIAG